MEDKNFAQRLKELRRKARLTQEELANLVKVSPITERRWEWGERTPRMEEIKKLDKNYPVLGRPDDPIIMERIYSKIE